MLVLKAFCATQTNAVPLIFYLFFYFFYSLMVRGQEEKTDLKDQMGVHLLTLPLTVLYARYVFFSF